MSTAVDHFLTDIEQSNKSDGTAKTYRTHLTQFSTWLSEQGIDDISDVRWRELNAHLRELESEGYAGKTVRLRESALRSFFKFAMKAEFVDENPCEHLESGEYGSDQSERDKLAKDDGDRFLPWDDVKEVASNAPDPPLRNELLIRLQFETFTRVGELVKIRVENVDLSRRELTVDSIKQRNGREKSRTLWWYTDRTDELMRRFLNRGYRDGYAQASQSPYLFPTQNRAHLSANRANRIVKEAADNAGLQDVIDQDAVGRNRYLITSHMLRHSGISFLINECGVPRETVKDMAGHGPADTTMQYTHEDTDTRRSLIMRKTADVV